MSDILLIGAGKDFFLDEEKLHAAATASGITAIKFVVQCMRQPSGYVEPLIGGKDAISKQISKAGVEVLLHAAKIMAEMHGHERHLSELIGKNKLVMS